MKNCANKPSRMSVWLTALAIIMGVFMHPEAKAGALTESLDKTITGTVVDAATNEPLPFVTVKVKGTTLGMVTDADGRFNLSIPDNSDVLVFSFVGYVT